MTKKTKNAPSAPECEKLRQVSDKSNAQGAFLDWLLGEKGFTLARYADSGGLYPVSRNMEELLAEYHGIDLAKVEKERRALLEYLRESGS